MKDGRKCSIVVWFFRVEKEKGEEKEMGGAEL
jgi:hypothetical protein